MPKYRTGLSRAERLAHNKGKYANHCTTGELAKMLGVHPKTIAAWRKAGKIPPPDAQANNGWLLWSPAAVGRIIKARTNRGER